MFLIWWNCFDCCCFPINVIDTFVQHYLDINLHVITCSMTRFVHVFIFSLSETRQDEIQIWLRRTIRKICLEKAGSRWSREGGSSSPPNPRGPSAMVLMACNWCLALLQRRLSCRVAPLAAFQRVTGLCVPLRLVLSPLEEWTAAWVRHSSTEDAKPPTAVRHYSLKAGSVDGVNQLHDGRFMLETSVQANTHTQSIRRGASVLLNDLFYVHCSYL